MAKFNVKLKEAKKGIDFYIDNTCNYTDELYVGMGVKMYKVAKYLLVNKEYRGFKFKCIK